MAFNLLQRIERIDDAVELEREVGLVFASFGVTQFRSVLLARPGEPVAPRLELGRSEQSWAQRYVEQDYARIDPFVPWVFQTSRPASWGDLEERPLTPEQISLFGEQREFGDREGLVIPVHSASGTVRCVILTGDHPDFSAQSRPILRTIAIYFSELAAELDQTEIDEPTSSPLTRRQVECLLWAANGKSDWDIGQILGISESTVHRHIERAKSALDVATRVQAIVVAWKSGWLVV